MTAAKKSNVRGAADARAEHGVKPSRQLSQTATPQSGSTTGPSAPAALKPTKLAVLTELLSRPEGSTLAEMTATTGWQTHSVRGAIAGALKKKGFTVTSEKADGVRRYRIGDTA